MIMAYKYKGKYKYWDRELNKQIRPGDVVEKKALKDSYYEDVEQTLEELHAAKTKVQLVKSMEAKEAQIKHLTEEVKVLKELYEKPKKGKKKKEVKK